MADRIDNLPFDKAQRLVKGLLSDLITVHEDRRLEIPWRFNYDLVKEILGGDNNPGPNPKLNQEIIHILKRCSS
jgi:hypothetical protein